MHRMYYQKFASCALFLCARFRLLQDSKREYMITRLENYEPSTSPREGELAAVLQAMGSTKQGQDCKTDTA